LPEDSAVEEVELPGGYTLMVRGPGIVELLEGEVEVFGARISRGRRLQVPEGRVLPLEAISDSFLRSSAEPGEVVKGSTVPNSWAELAEEALEARKILVIGANDTGKSSLVLYAANRAAREGRRPAVVDADVGQSDVGPLGTIGMAILREPAPTYSELELADAYFVGDKSPVGHLLPMIVGSRLMVDEALEAGAAPVLVNTTGLVEGSVGWALKVHKIEALRPDLLVLIERESELEHIARSAPRDVKIVRLRPPASMRKDRGWRMRYRAANLSSLAARRAPIELDLRSLRVLNASSLVLEEDAELARRLEVAAGVRPVAAGRFGEEAVAVFRDRLEQQSFSYASAVLRGYGEPRIVTLDRLVGLYMGLIDGRGRFAGVGRMTDLDLRSGALRGEAAFVGARDVGGVVFGYLILDDQWQEIGSIRPGYFRSDRSISKYVFSTGFQSIPSSRAISLRPCTPMAASAASSSTNVPRPSTSSRVTMAAPTR